MVGFVDVLPRGIIRSSRCHLRIATSALYGRHGPQDVAFVAAAIAALITVTPPRLPRLAKIDAANPAAPDASGSQIDPLRVRAVPNARSSATLAGNARAQARHRRRRAVTSAT
jgi:hypothetical protein